MTGTPPELPSRPFDASQERIYRQFLRLSPGAAAFFKDACRLMNERPDFEALSHIVGHLLRELESALCRIVLPLLPEPSGPGADPEGAGAADQQKRDNHRPKVERILRRLGIDPDSEAGGWLSLVGLLHRLAHRKGLEAPRPVDRPFEQTWDAFLRTLDAVLTKLEHHYAGFHERIDALLASSRHAHEIVAQITHFPPDAELLDYFLDRVNKTRGDRAHTFLERLRDADFYTQVPDVIEEGESIRHPPWPAGRFFAQHAKSVPDIALDILTQIPDSRNRFVLLHCLDAAATLPVDHLDRWVRMKRRSWRQVRYWDLLLGEKLGTIAVRLIDGGRPRNALALANCLLRPATTAASEADTRDRAAHLRIDDYEAQRLMEQHLEQAVDRHAVATILFLSRQLERVLAGHAENPRHPYGPPSSLWHPAIEDCSQNVYQGTPRIIYLNAVRDAADRAVSAGLVGVRDVVDILRRRKPTVFGRIILHLLTKHSDPELVPEVLGDRSWFLDPEYYHEYWALAVSAFPRLAEAHRRALIESIMQGPGEETLRAVASWGRDHPPTDEDVRRCLAWWRLQRLVMLEKHLDQSGRTLLAGEEAITKGRPDHPEFLSYHTAGFRGYSSPIGIDELRRMTDAELLDWLRNWTPPARREIDSPSREGLASMITHLTVEAPARFATLAPRFVDVHPTYCRGLLMGMDRVVQKAEQPINWRPVLECIRAVSAQPAGPSDIDHSLEEDVGWGYCRYWAASLLRTLTEKRVIAIQDRQVLWDCIAAFLRDPYPAADHESVDDPLSTAIASVRGNALQAAFFYGNWLRSTLPSWNGLADAREAQEALAFHADARQERSVAIHTLYGWLYRFLFFIDAKWTSEAREMIFPTEPSLVEYRDAAWANFLASNPAHPAYFEALRPEYERAVSEVGTRELNARRGLHPDRALGEHLVALYWQGAIELGPDSLLTKFFAAPGDDLRAHVIESEGRGMIHAQSMEEFCRDRLMRFSELRVRLGAEAPESHRKELASFVWWFAAKHFPPEWALQQILHVLETGSGVNPDFLFFQRLHATCDQYPSLAVRCLWTYLERGKHMQWLDHHKDEIRAVLSAGMRSPETPTHELVRQAVSKLAYLGLPAFRDVLQEGPADAAD